LSAYYQYNKQRIKQASNKMKFLLSFVVTATAVLVNVVSAFAPPQAIVRQHPAPNVMTFASVKSSPTSSLRKSNAGGSLKMTTQ
jgi:hypothetical protein